QVGKLERDAALLAMGPPENSPLRRRAEADIRAVKKEAKKAASPSIYPNDFFDSWLSDDHVPAYLKNEAGGNFGFYSNTPPVPNFSASLKMLEEQENKLVQLLQARRRGEEVSLEFGYIGIPDLIQDITDGLALLGNLSGKKVVVPAAPPIPKLID